MFETFTFPPGLILIIGGLLLPLLKGGWRQAAVLALPLLTLYDVWSVPAEDAFQTDFMGYPLTLIHVHAYTHIFATIFCIAAFAGALFALKHASTKELSAAMIYAGAAVSTTFVGDLISLFIFWEVMALASCVIVLSGGTEQARAAGMRYIAMHLLSGILLMAGITAHIAITGSDTVTHFLISSENWLALPDNFSPSGVARAFEVESLGVWLIFIGILVNLAAPPFSAWLADAYPEASPFGTVFLSAFTTKTAVFVMLTLFSGSEILIYIGLFMVFYGIVYAMLENDMRRILAYSIVNQVGFMVTGIGIGTEMALNGAAAHAFCHIIYKALLLMSAGSVLFMTGRRKCTELGGLYHSMPLTAICGIIGALAISAFPLTSGFVSKSMISDAAAMEHLPWVWYALAAASAGVFLHAGIKFPWFVFFQRDSGLRPTDPPANMRLAMILMAALCILPGIWPDPLYALLPQPVEYDPNTAAHFVTQLQLLLFSGLAFFALLPWLQRTQTITIDLDWFYRVLLLKLMKFIFMVGMAVYHIVVAAGATVAAWTIISTRTIATQPMFLARTFPLGNTALWVSFLLGVYLLIYYNV